LERWSTLKNSLPTVKNNLDDHKGSTNLIVDDNSILICRTSLLASR